MRLSQPPGSREDGGGSEALRFCTLSHIPLVQPHVRTGVICTRQTQGKPGGPSSLTSTFLEASPLLTRHLIRVGARVSRSQAGLPGQRRGPGSSLRPQSPSGLWATSGESPRGSEPAGVAEPPLDLVLMSGLKGRNPCRTFLPETGRFPNPQGSEFEHPTSRNPWLQLLHFNPLSVHPTCKYLCTHKC